MQNTPINYAAEGLPICIYHANCFDGSASGWVAWRFFQEMVEMVPMQYGDSVSALNCTGRDVYIVDFSFPKHILEALCEEASWVTVIDHHKAAQEDCTYQDQNQMPGNLTLIFNMEQSGCGLTWKHFYGRNLAPQLLYHIQDRDLWQFELQDTKAIGAALGLHDYSMETYAKLMDMDTSNLAQVGEVLLQKQAREIDQLLSTSVIWRTIGMHAVPVVNCPPWLASEVGHTLMEKFGCAFAATYHDFGGERKFSLRSNACGLDVSKLAKEFGGGGHRNAAGFTVAQNFQFPADIPL